jgi:hypothetical protein
MDQIETAWEIIDTAKPKWHQIGKYTLTKFEIPVELQVRCDRWEEGLKYVRTKKLNNCLTVDCADEHAARVQLHEVIQTWFDDSTLALQPGQLIYFKIYDE